MKKIKYFVLLISFIFLCTGCVKFNANMNIKKNKSMDFSIIYAVDTSLFGKTEILKDDDKKKLEKDGFKVKDYKDDKMEGFEITKSIKNIDKISSDKDVEYSLSGIVDGKNESDKLFKVKKGLFKNRYIAKFDFNSSDSNLSSGNTSFRETEDDAENTEDTTDSYDYSSFTKGMDLSFNVTLPYSAIKNNASEASNKNKELKWDLATSNKDAIEFEFELYNRKIIYGFIAVIIIVIGGFVFYMFGRKKKNSEDKVAV